MKIEIFTYEFEDKQTLGECFITKDGVDLFKAKSLERADNDNKKSVSCVPRGKTYKCVLEYSPRFDTMLWELKDVPNRSECKFHSANFWRQLNGCIALGDELVDIDGDGYRDVTNSKNTMKRFHKVLEGLTEIELIIH